MRRKDKKKFEVADNIFRDKLDVLQNVPGLINNFNLNYVGQPFSKNLDLKVAASNVDFTKTELDSVLNKSGWGANLVVIKRIIFVIRWDSNNYAYSKFGDDTALSTGIEIHYHFSGVICELFGADIIKDNGDFKHIGYDARIDPDTDATLKGNILSARISFSRFSPNGIILDFNNSDFLRFKINDDLSGSANTEISVKVQGYSWMLHKN